MEIALIKQIASVLSLKGTWVLISFSALWVYKLLKEKYEQHKYRRTETLINLKEYFDTPENERNIFLKELLFEDHFGRYLSWKEVSFFLNKPKPIKLLRMYTTCRKYIRLCEESNSIYLKSKNTINRIKWIYLVGYFISGVLALLMLFGAYYALSANGPELFAPWAIVTLSSATLSGIFMHESMAADTAKRLVKEFDV